jgi:hypothetical protein
MTAFLALGIRRWRSPQMMVKVKGFTVDGKLVTFDFYTIERFNIRRLEYNGSRDRDEVHWKVFVDTLAPYFDKCGFKRVVVLAPVKETGAFNVVLGCKNHIGQPLFQMNLRENEE